MMQEIGNSNAQWWSKHLLISLDGGAGGWCQIGLRQLSGMLVLVFARCRLRDVLGEVSVGRADGAASVNTTIAAGDIRLRSKASHKPCKFELLCAISNA